MSKPNYSNPMKEWRKKFKANGGKIVQLHMTKETVEALEAFCKKHNVTATEGIIHAILSLE